VKRGFTLLLSLLSAASCAHAEQLAVPSRPAVEILASQRVNNREQRVVFPITPGRTGVAAIAVRSGSETIQLQSLEIAYANGEHKNIELSEAIPPGRQSRMSEIPAPAPIVEIVVWKRPGLRTGETMMQVLATRQQAPRPAAAPAQSGFQLLDSQNVDQRGERISFRLGRGEHRYTAIKLRALDDPLTFTRAEIEFDDGQKHDVKFFIRVEPGQTTAAFEIPGEPRQIDRITAWKLPSTHPGRTGIELLGLAAPKR
jgi:hypothetical protein